MTERDLGENATPAQVTQKVEYKPFGSSIFLKTTLINPDGTPNRIRLEKIKPAKVDIDLPRDLPLT